MTTMKMMVKYRCVVCNYIYDPEKGDPDNGIQPGTSFDELPDSWVCPVCGVDKNSFERLRENDEVVTRPSERSEY